jgi:hypothetical protein
MDLFLTLLIVLLVAVLAYFLVSSMAVTPNVLADYVSLLEEATPVPIENIANPQSVNYTYSFWIYVSSWTNTETKPIITYADTDAAKTYFKLYLDPTDTNVYCDILTQTGQQTVLITNTLPLQKWVQVLVSVENRNVDCYINGKMSNATVLTSLQVLPSQTATITIGGGQLLDAKLRKVSLIPETSNPSGVWQNYVANSLNMALQASDDIQKLKLGLLLNNEVQSESTLTI